jgi:hypothetical protein
MNKYRLLTAAVPVALGCVMLAACGGSSSGGDPGTPVEVVIGDPPVVPINPDNLPLFLCAPPGHASV